MKEDYTHITFLLDRSGSMNSCWPDVVGGFKQLIKDQKKEAGQCTFTLVAFDEKYEEVISHENINQVDELLKIQPRGYTALLDALGKSVVETGEFLSGLKEEDRPLKVLFVVQTDGAENASKEYTKEKIKQLIGQQQDQYNWKFLFLGADQNSIQDAQNLGFSVETTSMYSTADTMTRGVSSKLRQVRSATKEAYQEGSVAKFSAEDKKQLNS